MSGDLFQQQRQQGVTTRELSEQFPIYPLNAPGLPVPGDNFIQAAISMGDAPPVVAGKTKKLMRLESWGPNLEYLYRRALYDENFAMNIAAKGGPKLMRFVPGHLLGDETDGMMGGPRVAPVMVLGKNPGPYEVEQKRNFVGPASEIFDDAINELGIGNERFNWYVDNLVHWSQVDEQSSTLPVAHIQESDMLLQQTLRLVRPEYLLCLGSDASKHLLGKQFGVEAMTGRMRLLTIPIHFAGEEPRYHTIKVMTARHPASVYRTPELYPDFLDAIAQFVSLTQGAEIGRRETFIRHINVYKHRQLKAIVDRILTDPDPLRRIIAVDGEWEGDSPINPGSYLRTIQFSTAHGEGICVVLRHQGGEPAFVPSIDHAIHELKRLLKSDPTRDYYPRVGGHFFRADLPWLIHSGLDLRDEYEVAPSPEQCQVMGGWDSGLMYHAYNETASYRLTDMTVRLTQAPVYDARLKQHITDYCIENDIDKSELEGFGFLPQWILHPEPTDPEWGDNYAQYDPDVTRRIAIRHFAELLPRDWSGNPCWEPFWRSHRASLGVLEMEMTGLPLDSDRVDRLTTLYMDCHNRLLEEFRRSINWPAFNPNSTPQCVAFLFGDDFGRKLDKKSGVFSYIRPRDAMTMNMTPVKTTGKRSKLWEDVVRRGEAHLHSPSTDKEVLGILGQHHPAIMMLRDIKFIGQVLKGPLREPMMDESGQWLRDDTGHLQYKKGLAAEAQADGRVHTHISQNKETGRASSSRPPLQNISKRREDDYKRILGHLVTDKETGEKKYKGDYPAIFPTPHYLAPIRTIFRAPEGHVLVEADYTGAELAVIAWLAGDRNMIEHVRRNSLPEDDPNHFDIHSNRAVSAFRLACPPTKKGLKDSGYASLRVAAKNVNFGIPYGRSAEAIARQCKEEGTEVSVADCQRMIDAYFADYPDVAAFLADCRNRSQQARWMAGSFGRFRRFIATRDRSVIGEQERQAQNFPIQNTVADAVWTAVHNFYEFRQRNPDYRYKIGLQIHDALLFLVPIPQLRMFLDNCLRQCMIEQVPIWPRRLDNTPLPVNEPYYFGIDHDVQINWGEGISEAKAAELGIDLDLV